MFGCVYRTSIWAYTIVLRAWPKDSLYHNSLPDDVTGTVSTDSLYICYNNWLYESIQNYVMMSNWTWTSTLPISHWIYLSYSSSVLYSARHHSYLFKVRPAVSVARSWLAGRCVACVKIESVLFLRGRPLRGLRGRCVACVAYFQFGLRILLRALRIPLRKISVVAYSLACVAYSLRIFSVLAYSVASVAYSLRKISVVAYSLACVAYSLAYFSTQRPLRCVHCVACVGWKLGLKLIKNIITTLA